MWTMRDGTRIKIKDMTTSHIINSIKLLERSKYGQLLKADITDNLNEFEVAEIDPLSPLIQWKCIYAELKDELKRRKR